MYAYSSLSSPAPTHISTTHRSHNTHTYKHTYTQKSTQTWCSNQKSTFHHWALTQAIPPPGIPFPLISTWPYLKFGDWLKSQIFQWDVLSSSLTYQNLSASYYIFKDDESDQRELNDLLWKNLNYVLFSQYVRYIFSNHVAWTLPTSPVLQ